MLSDPQYAFYDLAFTILISISGLFYITESQFAKMLDHCDRMFTTQSGSCDN